MKWLGIRSYRFSVAWPRILPAGRYQVNPAGLDFYDELVDGLLEPASSPMVDALPLGSAAAARGSGRLGRARRRSTPSSSMPTSSPICSAIA